MTPLFSKNSAVYDGHFAVELVNFILSIDEVKKAFPNIADEANTIIHMLDVGEKERSAAVLYRRTETFLVSNHPSRYSTDKLRETVNKKIHPERVCEGASLLFLNPQMRAVSLFRLFINHLAYRAIQSLGKDNFVEATTKRFADQKLAAFYIKNEKMICSDVNLWLNDIPEGEKMIKAQENFLRFTTFLTNLLRERIQDARTQLLIEDIYRSMKKEYVFLDDFPMVLAVVADQNILKDERVGMLSKSQLTEHARLQSRKVEETLAELQHEKDKLEQALKQLEASQEKLKALDYAKGQFIDVVSHQFRTPLSTIRWSSEMLKDEYGDKIPKEGKSFLETISFKSVFLINILNDIFDVLQVEGGGLSLQKKPAQLWEMISDQMKSMETEASKHNVKLVFEKSTNAINEVVVDHEMIRRTIEILIRNGINYSPEAGGQVSIKIGEEPFEGKNYVWVEVGDKGIGIADEDIPKMFSKFFRAQNAIRRVPDGAGLGLYLVRNIIELHGGRVAVASQLNNGAVFRFYIPIAT